MINGHFLNWAHEYLPTFMAAAGVIREALPVRKWIEIGTLAIFTALVTSVLTSNVTLARIDQRIIALENERKLLVSKRDEQVKKLEERDQRIEDKLNHIATEVAGLKARIK